MAIRSTPRRVRPTALPEYIRISGFKSLGDPGVRLQFGKLTLLAGGNSSGKSAVMQPLLLMKQTLEAPYDPGTLLLDGPHAQFTDVDQMLTRGKSKASRAKEMVVEFGALPDALRFASTSKLKQKPADSPPVRVSFFSSQQTRERGSYQLAPPRTAVGIGPGWVALRAGLDAETCAELLRTYRSPAFRAIRGLASAEVEHERFSSHLHINHVDQSQNVGDTISPMDPHIGWMMTLLHLPGLRGHRDRLYKAGNAGEGRTLIAQGPFTDYAAAVLARWQASGDERDKEQLRQVGQALRDLGLTWKVEARPVNAGQIELKVGRLPEPQQGGAHDLVDIADVGFGASQVLPVVVALIGAVRSQMVYIEQPELHLHPRAQSVMGRLLVDAAARGVRVVVETHSRLILRSIQTAIARDRLKPRDVALHWFTRDPKTGMTTVERAKLDDKGAFGEWPVDFSEAEAMADDRWLDAVYGEAVD